MDISKRTNTELAAILLLRTKRDSWTLKREQGKHHYALCPPEGHPFCTMATQWRLLQAGGPVIYIPDYAFRDDPKGTPQKPKIELTAKTLLQDVSSHEMAKLNLDNAKPTPAEPEPERYRFIGGTLDQKICTVGNPNYRVSYHGETYLKLKAGKVPFYAEESLSSRQAVFRYYMATDDGDSPVKFSRN
jgi:hypothetical protein